MTWARVQAHDLARELLKERVRQIIDEGYTDEHDDEEHGSGGLVALAGQYATDYLARGDRRRLVQAGALVLAALAAHDRRADADDDGDDGGRSRCYTCGTEHSDRYAWIYHRCADDCLRAVAEAARDHREGVVVADHSGICPHCGADDCWSDPEGAFMPLRCAATGRAVWVGGGDADEYLAAALDRLDAVTGGEHHRPSQSATKIHPLGGER